MKIWINFSKAVLGKGSSSWLGHFSVVEFRHLYVTLFPHCTEPVNALP